MHEHNNKIIIFTADYKIGAILKIQDGNIKSDIKDSSIQPQLKQILDFIKGKNPSMKIGDENKDGTYSIGLKEISPNDERYPTAIVEELNRRGLSTALVSNSLLKILELVTEKLPREILQKELGDFLAMTHKEAQTFYEDLKEVAGITKTLI